VGGGKAVLTPWTGRYGDYREIDGFRVPTSVEVAWELEQGAFSYARFRVTALEFNVGERFASRGALPPWLPSRPAGITAPVG
jgi:hypothetical protein